METALLSMSLWHAEKIPDVASTVIIGGPGWDPNPDHTAMLIQDWGVLTIYYRFLKDWLLISRKMIQDQIITTFPPPPPPPPSTSSLPPPCIKHRTCGDSSNKHKRRRKYTDSVT